MGLCTKTQTQLMEQPQKGVSGAAWKVPGPVGREAEKLQLLAAARRAGPRAPDTGAGDGTQAFQILLGDTGKHLL